MALASSSDCAVTRGSALVDRVFPFFFFVFAELLNSFLNPSFPLFCDLMLEAGNDVRMQEQLLMLTL